MSTITFCLKKMSTALENPVQYSFILENQVFSVNALLGQHIQLHYIQMIYCIQCGRKTSKSFQQGYCFPCYRRLSECGLCLIHPEKCRYYEGICSPNDWAHAHCIQPQVVYLANSSGLKIGVTRANHFYSRWIDQGATQGLCLFKVQNRHQAGLLEVVFKKFVADKTHWQTMLKGNHTILDLACERDALLVQARSDIEVIEAQFPNEIKAITDQVATRIDYPVMQYPTKIKTLDLDRNPLVAGILQGIKGQYWILNTGVISIRKFGGYCVALSC